MDDIYEPLERYRDELKDTFRKNTEEAFAEMERIAGVDAAANRAVCAKIDATQWKINRHRSDLGWMKFLRACAIVLGAGLLVSPAFHDVIREEWLAGTSVDQYSALILTGAAVAGIALIVLAFTALKKKVGEMSKDLEELEAAHRELVDEAERQMAPLNALFSWDIPAKLIEKTVPSIHFDPYFNAARLEQLCSEFGYNGFLNTDSSVLFAHSGDIKGNPFVIANVRKFRMGTKVYTGYRTIYWTEYETDEKGNRHAVTRSETLSASVEKPCPEYGNSTFLLYANEAAPNLNFSRTPEGLDGDSMFTGIRRNIKRRSLERYSRKLDDESDYTMMANRDFEVLFNTKDRDNEVEFRLLFTPLAQTSLLHLMHDRTEGFGDDFSVLKRRMINVVYPEHLQRFDIDTDPTRFMGYRLETVRQNFIRVNEEYFREIYFAFAPLLSIPLYQQTRTRKEIYGEKLMRSSSFWEWESLANFEGEARFAHPSSITGNILKTRFIRDGKEGEKIIQVTANGFSGTERVDYVSVYGGDGGFHDVPVEWVQYNPVSQSTPVSIVEMPEKDKAVIREDNYPVEKFRRKILISL